MKLLAETNNNLAQDRSEVLLPKTEPYAPLLIQGININYDDALKIDFLINKGDSDLSSEALNSESEKLIKYFLASLTIPEDEMWVNLSIYEEDRVIPENFGKTQMGSDLLAQDYMLKKVMSSMMYPDSEIGKKFWNKVYARAKEEFGITDIPLDTFNKVWIIASDAKIYEHAKGAFVVDSHMKVMMEEDYLAMEMSRQEKGPNKTRPELTYTNQNARMSKVTSEILRKIIIPELEREVNQGKLFANLRQIYNSMILASWYKRALEQSLLGQVYVDKGKTDGVEIEDRSINESIYQDYVHSVKKGVYTFIKEEYDAASKEIIARKYFSGGVRMKAPQVASMTLESVQSLDPEDFSLISAQLKETGIIENPDLAMASTGAVQKRLQESYAYLDELQQTQKEFQGLFYNGQLIAQGGGRFIDQAMTTTLGELKAPEGGLLGSEIFSRFMQRHFPESDDATVIEITAGQNGNVFVSGPEIETGVVRLPSTVKKEFQVPGEQAILNTFYFWPQQQNTDDEDEEDQALFYNGLQIGHKTDFVDVTADDGSVLTIPSGGTYQQILTRFLDTHNIDPRAITAQQEEGSNNWFVYGPPVTEDKKVQPQQKDEAMANNLGGIDLYPQNMTMRIEKDDKGGIAPIAPQFIENIHIKGFTPVIIEISPVSNLPVLIGFAVKQDRAI